MIDDLAFLRLRDDFVDGPNHADVLFLHRVVLAFDDLLETPNRLGDRHVLAVETGELLRDEEWLRQEPLNLARARDRQSILFRQLVDAENRDDVLQVLVALENLLYLTGDLVVLVADDARVEDA